MAITVWKLCGRTPNSRQLLLTACFLFLFWCITLYRVSSINQSKESDFLKVFIYIYMLEWSYWSLNCLPLILVYRNHYLLCIDQKTKMATTDGHSLMYWTVWENVNYLFLRNCSTDRTQTVNEWSMDGPSKSFMCFLVKTQKKNQSTTNPTDSIFLCLPQSIYCHYWTSKC